MMPYKFSHQPNKGFTLIEMLLYSAIIAVMLGSVFVVASSMLDTAEVARNRVELLENTRFLNQKLSWAIIGSAIVSPSVGATAPTLIVNRSTGLNPVTFDLVNGVVRMKTGLANPVQLTNGFVTVSSLSFQNYAFSNATKNTIRVKATLSTASPRLPASTSFDFFISVQ